MPAMAKPGPCNLALPVWTDTMSSGLVQDAANDCSNWGAAATPTGTAYLGDATSTTAWSIGGCNAANSCASPIVAYFYCFEQ
jgi:hypothetical protein